VKLTFAPAGAAPVVHDSVAEFHGPAEDLTQLPAQITAAWEIVLSRVPSDEELAMSLQFAGQQLSQMAVDSTGILPGRTPGQQVLVNLCQMLMNSNEFLYIE
jgi:hypothetical protein